MSSNDTGGGAVSASTTQRVAATPEPPLLSVAAALTCTGLVYQPLSPLGLAGSSVTVVVSAVVSVAAAVMSTFHLLSEPASSAAVSINYRLHVPLGLDALKSDIDVP